MSSRQIRRLQNLVVNVTGADADDSDGDGTSAMVVKIGGRDARKHARKKKSATLSVAAATTETKELKPTTDAPYPLSGTSPTNSCQAQLTVATPDLTSATTARDVPVETARKRQQKKEQRKMRRAREEEEEEQLLLAALEAAEASPEVSQGVVAAAAQAVDASRRHDRPEWSGPRRTVELLQCCDEKRLNVRLELIKMLGVAAVSDVGDGLTPANQRRRQGVVLGREHSGALPVFRKSAFATPNRYTWPIYSSLGVRLVAEKPAPADDADQVIYTLDVSSPEYSAAQRSFDACVESMAEVHDLMECFYRNPFHLPTLLQLHTTFHTIGDTVKSSEMLSMALYHVGVLFSRFPINQPASRRILPATPENMLVHETLQRGIHQALSRGCSRTALEMSKFSLSLDDTDPFGMLLLIDYLGLRTREWGFLHEVIHAMEDEGSRYRALPGYYFQAALAKYYTERELASSGDGNAKRTSAVERQAYRNCSPAQQELLAAAKPAVELLAEAVCTFPSAAVALVDKLGSAAQQVVYAAGWADVVRLHEAGRKLASEKVTDPLSLSSCPLRARHVAPEDLGAADIDDTDSVVSEDHDDDEVHGGRESGPSWVAQVFAEVSHELWKPRDAVQFLISSLREGITDERIRETAVARERYYRSEFLHRYARQFAPSFAPGRRSAESARNVIDPALLARIADEGNFEDMLDARSPATGADPDTIARYEALFGPLPPGLSSEEQMVVISDALSEHIMEANRDRNPVRLFFETMMPWNGLIQSTLVNLLATRGIPDPVGTRIAWERAADEAHWSYRSESSDMASDEFYEAMEYYPVPHRGGASGDDSDDEDDIDFEDAYFYSESD